MVKISIKNHKMVENKIVLYKLKNIIRILIMS